MKNRIRNYAKGCFILAIALLTNVSSLSAQELRTSYFMKSSTVRTLQNPAFRPERGFVSIPVLGMVSPNFSTNGISLDQIIYPKGNGSVLFLDPSVDANRFLNGLKDVNQLNAGVSMSILSAGWYSGKGFWTVDLSVKTLANVGIPKSLFEFAKRGNGPDGQTYDIKDVNLYGEGYAEASVGYSRPINDKLTVGGKLKYLAGMGSFEANIDHLRAVMNDGLWDITTQGTLNASVKGLTPETDVDNEGKEYISSFEFDTPGIAGYGFGVDLGASYQLTKDITLSASVLDLGFIRWGKDSNVHGAASGNYKFDGFDMEVEGGNGSKPKPSLSEQFDGLTEDLQDLFRFRQQNPQARTTRLRTTLNIGGEYEMLDHKLGFGLLSSTRFYTPKAYTELTASANYRPIHWFEAALSYSFVHSDFKTFGLALNFSPSWINFFVGTDYMLTKINAESIPVSSSAVNAYFGISVPIGRRHK